MIRLGITREKASILLLLFLPLYVMLTGAAPSVLRAALMSGVYLAGSLAKWRVRSATAICLSYIVLLLFNPYHLFEAGFQLSFAVSFSLILSSSIFQQVKPPWVSWQLYPSSPSSDRFRFSCIIFISFQSSAYR